MKITVEISGKRHDAPAPGAADHLKLDMACPLCAAPAPLLVAGKNMRIEDHDTYISDGYALCCQKPLGAIRAKMNTLFGLEEDEAVLLRGRARVY